MNLNEFGKVAAPAEKLTAGALGGLFSQAASIKVKPQPGLNNEMSLDI